MQENTILVREPLNSAVVKFVIYQPLIAAAAQAGQFVILRGREGGERVPVTLVDWDKEKGTITVIIQAIGKSTSLFNSFRMAACFIFTSALETEISRPACCKTRNHPRFASV